MGSGGPALLSTRSSRPGATSCWAVRSRSTTSRLRNAAFSENPLLLRAGDRVTFHRVEEEELLTLFEDVRADSYRYEIEEDVFDVGAYLDWLPQVRNEAEERHRRREDAAAVTPVP